ncbi:MAG: hypothetical protein ABJQ55_07505 [Hyphomicrobiales bacterium]
MSLVLCVTLSGCASVDYVPETGWGDNGWRADFYEEWFGGQLAAAGEPSLAKPADLGDSSSRFRLLILPTFSPASVYRIDQAGSGEMTLTYTLLNGAGGYDPGRIEVRTHRELTADEKRNFSNALDDAKLSSPQPVARLSATVDEDGNEIITICADGTRIVVESLSRNQRTFITRHECELERYPELGNLYTTVASLSSPD